MKQKKIEVKIMKKEIIYKILSLLSGIYDIIERTVPMQQSLKNKAFEDITSIEDLLQRG